MFFLYGWWLWLIIPTWGYVVFLYFLRQQPRKLEYPTLRFFQEVEIEARSLIYRKKPLLLIKLLLDLLLTGLIIMSLSIPYILTYRTSHLVLVVDSSLSLKASDIAPQRFTSLLQEARELLSRYPATRYSLILGEPPYPKIREARNARLVLDYIQELKPGNHSFMWKEALLLAKAHGGTEALIFLLTDGASLPATADISQYEAYFSGVGLSNLPSEVSEDNVFIKQLTIEEIAESSYLFLVLANQGSEEVSLKLQVEFRETVFERDLTLKGREERELAYKLEEKHPLVKAQIQIISGRDYLSEDNVAFSATGRKTPLKVGLVGQENLFLQAGLQALGGELEVINLKPEDVAYAGYDLYFMNQANLANLPLSPVVIVNPPGVNWREIPQVAGENSEYMMKTHPLFRYVNLDNLLIDKVYDKKHTGEVLLSLRQGGSEIPLIILETQPAFRLTFNFPLSASNLTLLPAFPTLLNNIISLTDRSSITTTTFKAVYLSEGEIVLPDGQVATLPEGEFLPPEAGIYEIRNVAGNFYMAVNYPPEESEISAKLTELPPPAEARRKPYTLTEYFLLGAIILLIGRSLWWRRG